MSEDVRALLSQWRNLGCPEDGAASCSRAGYEPASGLTSSGLGASALGDGAGQSQRGLCLARATQKMSMEPAPSFPWAKAYRPLVCLRQAVLVTQGSDFKHVKQVAADSWGCVGLLPYSRCQGRISGDFPFGVGNTLDNTVLISLLDPVVHREKGRQRHL